MKKRSPMQLFALALAVSLLLWPALAGAEGEKARKPSARSAESRARVLASMWWNEAALVEDLSLSGTVRSEMNRIYDSYLDERPKSGAGRAAFRDALNEGDWEKARKRLDEAVALAGEPLRAQGELKIAILSLLSDAQRAKLAKKDPNPLSQPWMAVRRAAAGQRKQPPGPEGE